MRIRVHSNRLSAVISLLTIGLLCVAFFVQGKAKAGTAIMMSKAAQSFLNSLNSEQKAKATYSFNDEQRFDWHFVPKDRKGLPLKEMTPEQRQSAMELLKVSLSAKGYLKASSIISLENVLAHIEGPNRRFPRDPELYYFTIFGDPAKNEHWGWRFEGHHISQNFTIANGKVAADAPAFMGTNPAEVRADLPQKGLRVLAGEEDVARAFLSSLTESQRKQAIINAKAPDDIITMNQREARVIDIAGLKASDLSSSQYSILMKLIDEYINNVPSDVSALRRKKVTSVKKNEILFAWAGPIERNQGHYYRIQGPTFLIEYDNTQNNANHIHSVWRDFNGDWGRDLLAEHYQQSTHIKMARR